MIYHPNGLWMPLKVLKRGEEKVAKTGNAYRLLDVVSLSVPRLLLKINLFGNMDTIKLSDGDECQLHVTPSTNPKYKEFCTANTESLLVFKNGGAKEHLDGGAKTHLETNNQKGNNDE